MFKNYSIIALKLRRILHINCMNITAQAQHISPEQRLLTASCSQGLPCGYPPIMFLEGLRMHRISVGPGWAYLHPTRAESGCVSGARFGLSVFSSHPACVPTAPTSQLESLMHYFHTKSCAWLYPVGPCIRRRSLADLFFIRLVPIIRSFLHNPGFYHLSFSCALFYRHLLSYFLFSQVSFRSVHLCYSLERTTDIPLDTFATQNVLCDYLPKIFDVVHYIIT